MSVDDVFNLGTLNDGENSLGISDTVITSTPCLFEFPVFSYHEKNMMSLQIKI